MTTAFLNAVLPHSKWIRLPSGNFVRIKKALYGLKEAPKEWFETFKKFMLDQGFHQSPVEPCIFFKKGIIVSLYVDDTLSTGEESIVKEFRKNLKARFKCGSGGLANLYLGLAIKQESSKITIDQNHYISEKLTQFETHLGPNPNLKCSTPLVPQFQELLIQADSTDDSEPSFPYRSMVGSLSHLVNGTRLDIAAATSIVSKFLHKPKKIHCDMVRRIYYYLRDTADVTLTFEKGLEINLSGFCDASYANLEDYRSLCGHLLLIGKTPVLWQASRQATTAKSTQQAEYMALTPLMQDLLWLKMLLKGLDIKVGTVTVYEDNEACIALANNPQSTRRTRHIQVVYHWIREHLEKKEAKLISIGTSNQLADLMTKGIYGPAMRTARERICLFRTEYENSRRNRQ
jgi:Reverse transcriptase (RNA-dependent DNA polymerase)